MTQKASILLVDDHPIFRQGLRQLLENEQDLEVVGEAPDGQVALELAGKLSPDLVVMDITMPKLDGIEATRQILAQAPEARIVALSVHSARRFVVNMLRAGASGYILKESVPEEMIKGIRTVLAGDVYLSMSITGIVVSDYKKLLSTTEETAAPPDEPILKAKLHLPTISADIIPRPRLVELLEEGRHRAMTLISAPAGYGKSILTCQWLEVCDCPHAWVSLDEGDNDLRVFLTYLLAAVKQVSPDISLKTQSLLQAAELPPAKTLGRYLMNDFDRVDEPFVLVLDDYHRISEMVVHDLLEELLRHPSPMLHLVLLTRRDPPLPLGSLRAGDQLTEIAMDHLRFRLEETTAFLERVLHVTIDEETAAVLEENVEGWVTGLRLAALSLNRKEDRDRIVQGLKERSHYVQDYLIKEVLAQVPTAYSRFLTDTSILDRFCAPLCEVMSSSKTGDDGGGERLSGQAFIDWLQETHLFVVPLDDAHEWFRYHHLFQELLQIQLKKQHDDEYIASLHGRAGTWLAGENHVEEAIGHTLKAGDLPGAVQIVQQNRQDVHNSDRWYIFEKWLATFSEDVIQQWPELLLTRIWIHYHHFDIPLIPAAIDAVEALAGDVPIEPAVQAEIDFFRGYICYFQDNDGARSLEFLQDALDNIPDTHHEIRGQTEILYGLACQMQGQNERAVEVLNQALDQYRSPHAIRQTRLLVTLVYINLIDGDLDKALAANERLFEVSNAGNFLYAKAWSIYLRGLNYFYRNDLTEAVICFRQAVDDRYILHMRAAVDSMAGLIFSYHAMGKADRAGAALQQLREYVSIVNDSAYSMIAESIQSRLSIMQDDSASATNRLRAEPPPAENMAWWLEIPSVTHCRVLIAEGSDENLDQALARLQELLQLNEDNHNTLHSIEIMSLLALTLYKQKQPDKSLAVLQRVCELAAPCGIVGSVAEAVSPMIEMLDQLDTSTIAADYLERVKAAVSGEAVPATSPGSDEQKTAPSPAAPTKKMAFLLTIREDEVLKLMAQGMSNKEIADQLYLSTETVKKHLYNVYQKLNAHNRTSALAIARELGVLSPQ